MVKRHRTSFPGDVNFSGWWIKSPTGRIAQLNKEGRDLRENTIYSLTFENGQVGNGRFLIENLVEMKSTIRLNREDFDDPKKP